MQGQHNPLDFIFRAIPAREQRLVLALCRHHKQLFCLHCPCARREKMLGTPAAQPLTLRVEMTSSPLSLVVMA